MKLCIDEGNTRTKVAVFESNVLKNVLFIDRNEDFSVWENLFSENKISSAILSSVKKNNSHLTTFLQSKTPHFIELSHRTPLPIINCYQTPETLGKDRLAAVVGAATLQPNQDILVIDAGTAITCDFINAQGEYIGGNITPGVGMRFRALYRFTDKLPLVAYKKHCPPLGTDTETAIRAGVQQGVLYEIEGYVHHLKQQYPDVLIFLTGGDSFFLAEKLKNSIFAEENLVLIGLNAILNYELKNMN